MDQWLCLFSFGLCKGAGSHVVCGKCSCSSSLSYSAGSVSSSFSAEPTALVHGLELCHSHLKSCHFQSALFVTDSQLALTLLSSAPAFLQPKSFCDIWDLSDSFSSRVDLSFQWIPGHAGLSENERADSLVKTGATLSCLPAHWHRALQRLDTLATLCGNKFFSQLPSLPDSFSFLRGTGPFPSYPL